MSAKMKANPSWATVAGRHVKFYEDRKTCKKENPKRPVFMTYVVDDIILVETADRKKRMQLEGTTPEEAVRQMNKALS